MNLNKGDFIGRDALVKQKEEGITQKLVCLSLENSDIVVLGKEPIRADGEIIGWVASGGYGYSVGKSIAYGYLPVEYAKAGTELEIEIFEERVNAIIERDPLWDPKGTRIKA